MIIFLGVMIIVGIYLIFEDSLKYLLRDFFKCIKDIFSFTQKTSLEKYISKIFMVISKEGQEKRDMTFFYIFTFGILFVSLFVLITIFKNNAMIQNREIQTEDYVTAIALSVSMALMPFAYIRSKLVLVQRAGSFEGEAFLKELFTQYKLSNGNIVTTILETVKGLTENEPVTKKALFHLSLKITKIKSDDELQDALDTFVYAINTNWVKILANDFYSAIKDKTDIYAGLEDQLENCKIINENLEADKRGSLESFAMIQLLTPAMLYFLAKMALEMMPFEKLVTYQFKTDTGIKLFCLILIVILGNYILTRLLLKPKYDI